ncbi:UDP-N-acetylmuramate dehydrogenase [Tetragenococcus halophilus]|uniref:UDP-N-acetylmuramate dehydrogenase n=1 Tax=Tetragenococcus halophilus TaxID=51669 RepID=UPI00083CD9B3|nr:UDP-N-acetylmuramate dehydrogenase [Tetragenococcus halophilus]AOF48611.1 UDP-N-acetylenolpyruvoylglucosamine reductase [Tetragenococcus halophilus]MCO7026877.1 UDP-N-acetylmuramate dehydrogenase [Tetragenococcus halophilus]MCO8284195.1 UDP-N-acetylmuramate dehydrogenase [Tetragenococcus halophilus]MCO8287568.1 UDP-N-acetylmuramate dehydrogenase [Tetragenococcus halophilus]MDN6164477.1 UDP-N-acetylmuramate dehydrogenase [Tetragenococcus halophilus]
MDKEKLVQQFPAINLLIDEPLKYYTFTKTGGPADVLAFPETAEEAEELVLYCRNHDIPWLVLGNASNLIVRDGGIRGLVIMLLSMDQIKVTDDTVEVQAGARLIDTSYAALDASLSGLEFACGIPGSVGGAVFMNAGAYGGEIKDVFASSDVLMPDGTVQTFSNQDMDFSYRNSIIQVRHGIILNARFSLQEGQHHFIKERMDELTYLRESKQPLEYPSCGSVFKRPPGHFTGQLIQEAGLQGLQWGGAQVSNKHAGFIINLDGATATDYVELIGHIQEVIKEKFDVDLQTEVRIIGEEVNETMVDKNQK